MTADTIRESLTGRPFRPFDVHTASGGVYHVPHPDCAWVSPSGRDLVVAADNDAVAILSLLHITELETRPTEPTTAGRFAVTDSPTPIHRRRFIDARQSDPVTNHFI